MRANAISFLKTVKNQIDRKSSNARRHLASILVWMILQTSRRYLREWEC